MTSVASGVAAAVVAVTNAVVAIRVEKSPAAGVGAVGVPVNAGDSMVALNAISAIFCVILAVFAVTLVSNPFSALVALVTSAVKLALVELMFDCKVVSAAVALVTSDVKLALVASILF